MTDGLKPKYREVIIAKLSAHPRVERIVLFGSRAMGTFTTTSDIDIALFGGSLTLSDQAILAEAMAELSIPQRVDILVYHRIESQPLREHIHRHGVEWFARRQRKSVTSAMAGEWVTTTLGNICTFVSGSVFPQSEQGKTHGKYPFIKVSDMNLSGNERFITRANNWIGEKTQARLRANVHPKGTTVFAKIGVALTYNRRRILSQPTIIDNNMMAAIAESGRVHSLFFYYLLRTIDFNEIVVGTALPYLNIGDLKRIAVTLPSPKQQQAIACILGTLDDKIELNRRMNETLEGMARVLFKAWFVDFDPVRAKAAGQKPSGLKPEIAALFPDSFEPSELGEIPKGWSIGTIGELCEKPQYGFTASAREEPIGFKFLRIKDINKLAWINWSTVPFCEIEPSDLEKYRLHIGDILIARMADPGHSAIIEEQVEAVFASYLIRFRLKDNAYTRYTQYWLRSKEYWDLVTSRGAGTTRASLNAHVLSSFQLIVPPKPIASAFGVITNGLRDKILLAVNESVALAALRDTLLPKLISGELRVPDVERIAGRCL